jgi:hypothetical protein
MLSKPEVSVAVTPAAERVKAVELNAETLAMSKRRNS